MAITREGVIRAKGTFNTNSKTDPKQIDIIQMEGKISDRVKGKPSLGIFQIKGDELYVCGNEPGEEERPSAFESKEGTTFSLMKFIRKK